MPRHCVTSSTACPNEDAITVTNSGKPIGRCPADTQSSALTSDKKLTSDFRGVIYRPCCNAQLMFWDGCQAGGCRTRIGEEPLFPDISGVRDTGWKPGI